MESKLDAWVRAAGLTSWPGAGPTRPELSLSLFRTAEPSLISSRALQTRVDTKFVMPATLLGKLVDLMHGDFSILESTSGPIAPYRTTYFDSEDYASFRAHRQGRRPRGKLRCRQYTDRRESFLELKIRDRNELTRKYRYPRSFDDLDLTEAELAHLSETEGFDRARRFHPCLRVEFSRISLLGLTVNERVTLDVGMEVSLLRAGVRNEVRFPDVVIGEIKQGRFSARSPAMQAIRHCGIRPVRLSKYCIGIATTAYPRVPPPFRDQVRVLMRNCSA